MRGGGGYTSDVLQRRELHIFETARTRMISGSVRDGGLPV